MPHPQPGFRPGRRTPLLAALALLAAGCAEAGAGASAGTAFVTVDSSGVSIAESAAPAWGSGEGWTIAAEPSLEIGLADGAPEYLLGRVVSATRRDDGSIVIANGVSNEIRFYDAAGRHLRSVGREGGGPGEYQQIQWAEAIRGDTLLVYDMYARRLSVLAPDGTFLQSHTMDGPGSVPLVNTALADGSLVGTDSRDVGNVESTATGLKESQEIVVHLDRTGAVLDTVAIEEATREYVQVVAGDGFTGMGIFPMVFGPRTLLAPMGDRLLVARSDEWRLRIYGPGAGLDAVVRRPIAPRPVTDAVMAAERRARQERLDAISDPSARQRRAESMEGQPVAEVLPFFSRVLAGTDGRIWLQNYRAPGDESPPWTVHDSDGRLLGEVMLPDRFTPREFGADYVLGVYRDELDVERVRMYAIEQGAGEEGT